MRLGELPRPLRPEIIEIMQMSALLIMFVMVGALREFGIATARGIWAMMGARGFKLWVIKCEEGFSMWLGHGGGLG